MTTIAYRNGIMAGDTRVTLGSLVLPERARKVFRLRNGCLFGHCGSVEEGERLKLALQKNESAPKLKDSDAIYVMPNGDILFYEGVVWTKLNAEFVAIGSGKVGAYGAMLTRKDVTAREAVAVACRLDTLSGLPIQTVRLKCTTSSPSRSSQST